MTGDHGMLQIDQIVDKGQTGVVDPVVSVVVAARNSARDLPHLFAALEAQTLPRHCFEVIVIDDGSVDGTGDVAEQSGIARTIRCETGVGLPRARNIGIRAAKGKLVAITDADVVPDPSWLELGVARTRETHADILGGRVLIALGEKPSIAALVDAMNWFNQERCIEQGFALGGTLFAPRETFDRWGLFNEHIEVYGHEDVEWGRRATTRGARLVYAPDVLLGHPPRTRLRAVARKAYRLGFGLAPQRRIAHSAFRDLPPLFLRPTPFLPPRSLDLGRLRDLGQKPTRSQVVLLYLAQWLCVGLPKIAGDFSGELKYAWTHRSGRAEPWSAVVLRGVTRARRAFAQIGSSVERLLVSRVARRVVQERLTYLSISRLRNIEHCIRETNRRGIPGAFLEAGVALGGSAIVMASQMGPRRSFHGYDVFAQIPAPSELDGADAHERYRVIARGESKGLAGDEYYGYMPHLHELVVEAFHRHGLEVDGTRIALHAGLFSETLICDGPVALAHLDCDWYESVRLCLERVGPSLSEGGYIVVDDYTAYSGCAKAVDDFLASHPEIRPVRSDSNLVLQRKSAS